MADVCVVAPKSVVAEIRFVQRQATDVHSGPIYTPKFAFVLNDDVFKTYFETPHDRSSVTVANESVRSCSSAGR